MCQSCPSKASVAIAFITIAKDLIARVIVIVIVFRHTQVLFDSFVHCSRHKLSNTKLISKDQSIIAIVAFVLITIVSTIVIVIAVVITIGMGRFPTR